MANAPTQEKHVNVQCPCDKTSSTRQSRVNIMDKVFAKPVWVSSVQTASTIRQLNLIFVFSSHALTIHGSLSSVERSLLPRSQIYTHARTHAHTHTHTHTHTLSHSQAACKTQHGIYTLAQYSEKKHSICTSITQHLQQIATQMSSSTNQAPFSY